MWYALLPSIALIAGWILGAFQMYSVMSNKDQS